MKNRGNNQKTIKQLKPKHINNKYIKYKWSKFTNNNQKSKMVKMDFKN